MGFKYRIAVMAVMLALLAGAGLFSQLAPDRYGLPQIEVKDPGATGQRVKEGELFGNFFPATSDTNGPLPAVLLLGGSEGGLGGSAHSMALALQKGGFSVFHLAYFGGPGQSDALERVPLELFDHALEWLKRRPDIDSERLAIVGASKGAEAALLIASRRSDVRAVVAGTPTSVAWNGIDWAKRGQSPHSSWTVDGRDIQTMPFSDWDSAEGIISVYRGVVDPARSAEMQRAAIEIERATARVLLVCGEAETMWPACPMARMVASRSKDRSGPQVTILSYPDAGHFVFGPPLSSDNPFYERLDSFGGTVEGNALARADSWPQIIAFLNVATRRP